MGDISENKTIELILKNSTATTFQIGQRTKYIDCAVNGALPDPDCTPGDIFSDAGTSTICVSGYTKTVRDVPLNLKKISYPQPTGSYEADHLIPLELGGSNDIANLFPEAGDPKPGFKEKDLVENYLHNEVCKGLIPLDIAQKQIAIDWLSVYLSLSGEEITFLKNQYKNWSIN